MDACHSICTDKVTLQSLDIPMKIIKQSNCHRPIQKSSPFIACSSLQSHVLECQRHAVGLLRAEALLVDHTKLHSWSVVDEKGTVGGDLAV